MKKLVYSLVITFLMGLSVNAFAQKPPAGTVAYLNVKTYKKAIDDKTAIVTFQLNNITDETIKQKYKAVFAKQQRIMEVTATTLKGNMASFAIKTDKVGELETLQRILMKAQVASVNIDGTVVPTVDLIKYRDAQKAKK